MSTNRPVMTAAFNLLLKAANIVSLFALCIMVVLTTMDVFLRYLFSKPITGNIEMTQFLMVFIAFGMGLGLSNGKVIKLTLLSEKFTPKVSSVVESTTDLIGIAFLIVVSWTLFSEGVLSKHMYTVSNILMWPFYIFQIAMALAFTILLAAMLGKFIIDIENMVKR